RVVVLRLIHTEPLTKRYPGRSPSLRMVCVEALRELVLVLIKNWGVNAGGPSVVFCAGGRDRNPALPVVREMKPVEPLRCREQKEKTERTGQCELDYTPVSMTGSKLL
ncbi:MAG: hypothetical protein WB390_00015, partial [Pseudolabrys sp.]